MEDGKTTWATNPDVSQLRVKTVKSCNQGTFENLPSRLPGWRAARSAGCFLEKSGLKAAESGFVPEARRESSASNSEDFLSWTTSHETLTKRGDCLPNFLPWQRAPHCSPVASARSGPVVCRVSLSPLQGSVYAHEPLHQAEQSVLEMEGL